MTGTYNIDLRINCFKILPFIISLSCNPLQCSVVLATRWILQQCCRRPAIYTEVLQFNFTVDTVDYWGIRWHQLHLNEIRQCVRGVLRETRKNPWSQIPGWTIIIQWCYWWRSLSGNNWFQKVMTDQLESSISESCLQKPWKKMNKVRKKREKLFFFL